MSQAIVSRSRIWSQSGRVLLVVALLCASFGCTRRFFRNRADRDVDGLLAEKDVFEKWKIEQYHVYPDPRSRFADPTNPDRPPMPPDDPAAKLLSPNPQRPKHAGIDRVEGTGYFDLLAAWDAQNRQKLAEKAKDNGGPLPAAAQHNAEEQEPKLAAPPAAGGQKPNGAPADNPSSPKNDVETGPRPRKLEDTEPKPFLITLEQAVELGLVNSREFQTKREDLYLSALSVTNQRFGFAAQFFFTEEAARNWAGRATPEGQQRNWTLNSTTGFSKLFPSGALLLFKFANTTVIDLAGKAANNTASVSTLNLDLVQPFLRGGGRAVTLEPLTQSERNLVYEIRGYYRFREQFFANIATGGDLSLFNAQAVRRGYLPTLQRQAKLEIDRKNLNDLRVVFQRLEKLQEGGDFPPLQVETVRNQILNTENTVLTDEQDLRDAIDALKLQLGLPLNVPLELTFEPLEPVKDQFTRLEDIYDDLREATSIKAPADGAQARPLLRQVLTSYPIVHNTQLQKAILPRWATWEKGKLADAALKKKLEVLKARKAKAELAPKPWTPELEATLIEMNASINLGNLENALRDFEAQPWLKQPNAAKADIQRLDLFDEVLHFLDLVLREARDERLERDNGRWPDLAPIEIDGVDVLQTDLNHALETGGQAALTNRMDLMNARAQLVDAWRQIAVSANSLLGAFNVEYHLTGLSPVAKNQPLNVAGSHMRHQLALNSELPLVRLPERNVYRTRLIEFQRERRNLMQTEDQIVASIRGQIRQLRVLAQNYETLKKLADLAYKLRDSSQELLLQPPGLGRGALDYIALTNQYLQNQNNLVNRQSSLYNLWVSYHVTRMQLYRDLDMMRLDARGVWNDELANRPNPEPPNVAVPPGEK